MFRPTTDEILRSISRDFDEHVRPDPAGPFAVSLSLTISNLLRHVRLRDEREEGLIAADTTELVALLEQARDFAGRYDAPIADRIETGLAAAPEPALPASKAAARRWTDLRWLLTSTIEALQAMRPSHGDDLAYRALREAIRAYLDRSLARESTLITEAFTLARR